MSWADIGFNENLSIADAGQQDQQLDPLQFEQFAPEISGTKLSGLIQSRSGRLKLDLDNDAFIVSDGVIDTLRFGQLEDGSYGLFIQNKDGNVLMRIGDQNFIQSPDGNSKLDFDNNRYIVSEGGIPKLVIGVIDNV